MQDQAPVVTENLPRLFEAGPTPDQADVTFWYVRRVAEITIDAVAALHELSWWTGVFTGIGFVTTCFVVCALAASWWERRREHKRLDRLALDLGRRSFVDMTMEELAEAQKRWPTLYVLAAEIDRDSHARALHEAQDRARIELDEWFDVQRDEAVHAPTIYDGYQPIETGMRGEPPHQGSGARRA